MKTLRILMLGDLFGKTGCALFARHSAAIKKEHDIDAFIVNGENSCDGKGITDKIAAFLVAHGASLITTGNHIWAKKEMIARMNDQDTIIRPANYPENCPGRGIGFFNCKGYTVGVINLMGRICMPVTLDCPLQKANELIEQSSTSILLIDMHAETPYEKLGLAFELDGKVTAVVGTHTHVQTADARILPKGTAYMSDLGMSGSLHSMIGAKKEPLIERFLTQMPTRHQEETEPPYILSGAIIEIEAETGKALSIDTLQIIDDEPLIFKAIK